MAQNRKSIDKRPEWYALSMTLIQAKRAAELEEQRRAAAEEASAMPDLSLQEHTAMERLFKTHHLREEGVRPDGNCLYAAFASQLGSIKSEKVCAIPLVNAVRL
jgi:OTU domain-containing protein 6